MATVPRYLEPRSAPQRQPLPYQQDELQQPLTELTAYAKETGDIYAERRNTANKMADIAFVTNQAAQDRLNLNQHLNDLQNAAPPDGAGVTDAMLQAVDAQKEASLEAAPSPQAQQFLSEHYAELKTSFGMQAQEFEARSRAQHTANQVGDARDANAIYLASHPGDLDRVLAENDAAIGAIGTAAGRDPATIQQMQKENGEPLVVSALASSMLRDPLGTLSTLTKGTYDDRFEHPEKKSALIDASLVQYTQLQNQAYTQQERAKKNTEDQAAKEAEALIEKNQLTNGWLEANAGRLSADARHAYYDRVNKGPVTTDKNLYADLRANVDNPNTLVRADTAFRAGQLAQDDYDRIYSAADSSKPASPYRQGESYIKTELSKSPYDMKGFAIGQQATAEALDTFNLWMSRHPDADAKAIRDRYIGIVEERKQIDMSQDAIMLPLPRFHVGNQDNLDVKATFQALEDALANHQITQVEHDEQMDLLDKWDAIVETRDKAQADAAKAAKAPK